MFTIAPQPKSVATPFAIYSIFECARFLFADSNFGQGGTDMTHSQFRDGIHSGSDFGNLFSKW